MQRLLYAVATVATLSACGAKSGPKVQTMPAPADDGTQQLSGGGSGKGDCKTLEACPKAAADVASSGFANTGGLLGFVGKPVPWDFRGVDLNSSTRKVAVLLNAIPSGAKVEPEISTRAVYSEVQIVWTPDRKAKSSKPLELHLRDMERCLLALSEAKCNNGKVSLPDFDTKIDVAWQIEDEDELQAMADEQGDATDSGDGSVVSVQDPNCGPAATTDQQIQGKVLQGAIGVLTGGLPALIPGLLSTIAGGGGSSQPTQC